VPLTCSADVFDCRKKSAVQEVDGEGLRGEATDSRVQRQYVADHPLGIGFDVEIAGGLLVGGDEKELAKGRRHLADADVGRSNAAAPSIRQTICRGMLHGKHLAQQSVWKSGAA